MKKLAIYKMNESIETINCVLESEYRQLERKKEALEKLLAEVLGDLQILSGSLDRYIWKLKGDPELMTRMERAREG